MKTEQDIINPEQCRHIRRTVLGKTQAEIAKGAGVSRSMLGGFEIGTMAVSDPVKRRLRDYLETALAQQGIDPVEIFEPQEDSAHSEAGTPIEEPKRSALANGIGRWSKFIRGAECVYISGAVADEAERERIHERLETVRDRLIEIGEQEAKPGVFEPFDDATDKLIDEGRALITETGLLYLRLFGHDVAPAPTPAMVQRKQRPAAVADALGLMFADVFKTLRVRRNTKRADDEPGDKHGSALLA
jgi:transcriptional regulator with XRE-family HTH domain